LAGDRAATPRAIASAVEINGDESASVLGASAGGGVGVFVTNATRPEELRGPSKQGSSTLLGSESSLINLETRRSSRLLLALRWAPRIGQAKQRASQHQLCLNSFEGLMTSKCSKQHF